MLQTEQVVLSLKVAVPGAPEVVQLARQVGAQPFFTALTQQPADITGQLLRKAPLLLRRGQPAGQKKIVLRGGVYLPVKAGRIQGNKPALGKITDVEITFIHEVPVNAVLP